jgi:23S rRNA (cytosine1962-C5)-methyltransferase
VPEALKAYQRLNGLAFACLAEGGVLVSFSCSGRVTDADFQEAVARAAGAVGRRARIVERLGQGPDHPVSTACPESAYLKGLVCIAE